MFPKSQTKDIYFDDKLFLLDALDFYKKFINSKLSFMQMPFACMFNPLQEYRNDGQNFVEACT